jgi:hypothetical protein
MYVRVLPDLNVAYGQVKGSAIGKDLIAVMKRLFNHPDWRPGTDVIWDLSGLSGLGVGPEDFDDVVELRRKHIPDTITRRVVIVLPPGNELDDLVHLYQQIVPATFEITVFRSVHEALQHLGFDPGLTEQLLIPDPATGTDEPDVRQSSRSVARRV